jgi:short-subunit dehydrogenase
VVNGVLAAYPETAERGHGHIVNTASGLGLVGAPFVTKVDRELVQARR